MLQLTGLAGFGGGNVAGLFVANVVVGNITSSTTTPTLNVPTGAVAGDLLIYFLQTDEGMTSTTFSLAMTSLQTDSVASFAQQCFGRVCTGAEGASFTITFTKSRTYKYIGLLIRGVASGAIGTIVASNEILIENATTYDMPALTVPWGTTAPTLAIFFAWNAFAGLPTTIPSGYADAVSIGTTKNVWCVRKVLTAASENPTTVGWSSRQTKGGGLVLVKGA